MTNEIKATFVRRRFQDSGRDQAPDYYVYEFTGITDSDGKKYSDKWIKETKLMSAVSFQKGKQYKIILSSKPYLGDYINLPFPMEIAWDNERVYRKGGNSIIRVGKDKKETNLSVPLNKILGISNYDTAAVNKFGKGILTEELLLKMNARGLFFHVHYSDPQDKRKSKVYSYGSSKDKKKGNYILIQKETQEEINSDLKMIKEKYVHKKIEKYFKISKEILPPKKRVKK